MNKSFAESAYSFSFANANVHDNDSTVKKIIRSVIGVYVQDTTQLETFTEKTLDIVKKHSQQTKTSDLAVICVPKQHFLQVGYASQPIGIALSTQMITQLEEQLQSDPSTIPIQYRLLPYHFSRFGVKSYIVTPCTRQQRLASRQAIEVLSQEILKNNGLLSKLHMD